MLGPFSLRHPNAGEDYVEIPTSFEKSGCRALFSSKVIQNPKSRTSFLAEKAIGFLSRLQETVL
jgi:hypothetical protein